MNVGFFTECLFACYSTRILQR